MGVRVWRECGEREREGKCVSAWVGVRAWVNAWSVPVNGWSESKRTSE